jgi:hypothetical protein
VLLLIDRQTIERWLEEGLAREQHGDQTLIRREDLDTFLLRNGQGLSRDAAMEE